MKRLLVLRHAKSSWDDPSLPDRERPLAPRGRKAAKRVARLLEEKGVRPQLVLCSPALRATETLDRVADVLGAPEIVYEERLYHASADELLERLRAVHDTVAEVMLVGHNPGVADLCLLLTRPGEARDRVTENLPTGALATLDLGVAHWAELEPGCADLSELVVPRELG